MEFWEVVDLLCTVYVFVRTLGLNVSGMTISAIALDRMFVVTSPFKINSATRRAEVMVLICWACSIGLNVPEVSHDKYGKVRGLWLSAEVFIPSLLYFSTIKQGMITLLNNVILLRC